MSLTYNEMGTETLKKMLRKRKLVKAEYTQRIRKDEAIAILEAADRGDSVVVPQRIIDIYNAIHNGTGPAKPSAAELEAGAIEAQLSATAGKPVSIQSTESSTKPPAVCGTEQATQQIIQTIQSEEEGVTIEVYGGGSDSSDSSDSSETADEVFTNPNEGESMNNTMTGLNSFFQILRKMQEDIQANTKSVEAVTSTVGNHLADHPQASTASLSSISEEDIREAVAKYGLQSIEVTQVDKPTVNINSPHYLFPTLLRLVSAKANVYMVGPAGSGKTKAAYQLAKALFPGQAREKFDTISLCRQTSKGDLLGFRDAHGNYHESALVRIFKNGGVFLFDEVDQATDSIMKLTNMAIGNGAMSTPNGMVKRHPDFYVVAAANTFGVGADRVYCGANQLDASTLNRFFFLEWDYDDKLERIMAGVTAPSSAKCAMNKTPSPAQWLHVVRTSRENINKHRMRLVVSPRTTENGVLAIKAGLNLKEMLDGLIYMGLAEDKKKMVFDAERDFSEFEEVVEESPVVTEEVSVEEDISAAF
jgi:cobaltochelatase CobS